MEKENKKKHIYQIFLIHGCPLIHLGHSWAPNSAMLAYEKQAHIQLFKWQHVIFMGPFAQIQT